MTTSNRNIGSLGIHDRKLLPRLLSLSLIVTVIGLASAAHVDQPAEAAKPRIMNMEEAWDLKKNLIWDLERWEIHALIQSQIVVDNVTAGVLKGKITDGDGSVIRIYGKESVVMARYGYANGAESKWQIVTKPSSGYFSFEIPEKYASADYVELWVNSNSFSIKPGEYSSSIVESYHDQGNKIHVNHDGIFVVSGAPPLSYIDLSSEEGLELQDFAVYQGEIDAKVTSARGVRGLNK